MRRPDAAQAIREFGQRSAGRRRLDQRAVVRRDTDLTAGGQPLAGCQYADHILVNATDAQERAATRLQRVGELLRRRCQYRDAGGCKSQRPWARVPMQPTDTLQQHVAGGDVGDKPIGVNVERLLSRLCRDRDDAGTVTGLNKRLFQGFIKEVTILRCEASMVRRNHAPARQQPHRDSLKALHRLLCIGNPVADEEHSRSRISGRL